MKKLITRLVCLAALLATTPAMAGTLTVPAGGDLQGALNSAQRGDTILLAAGATFTGNFVLPAKSGSGVITVRSSAPNSQLPAPGIRITPAYAPRLAKIRSNSNGPALRTASAASGWRLLFLEFLPAPGTSTSTLVQFGQTGQAQTSLAQVPSNLEIDRSYFHGDAVTGQRRGLGLNSADSRVLNSYFEDFKAKLQDTQAIAGWNGPGPFLIENNYLEAAGENVMFGGSDPSIPNLVPSRITIRRNLISRPLAWMNEGWTVKNLLELKNAEHVLIEGNILENHWAGGQPGPAVVFTPRNQGHSAPWSRVRNVTFQNNIVRHVASAINILGHDNLAPSEQTENILVRNNLFYDVHARYAVGSGTAQARLLLIGAAPRNVRVDHNTVDNSGSATIFFYEGTTPIGPQVAGFELTNNLLRNNSWAIYGDTVGDGVTALAHYAPNALVLHNTFAGAAAKRYPTGNDFPSVASWLADFVSPSTGDYRLTSASASRGAATDGKDLGVDFAELKAALAGVAGSPAPVPEPTPVPTPVPTPQPVTSAYGGTAATLPGRVQVENFDVGGAGVAFKDTTSGNTGAAYRAGGVDIQRTSDTGGGYNVAWTRAGEWLTYTVNVARAGTYTLDLRVASYGTGGRLHVEVDGKNVSGAIAVPNTGGWQVWKTLSTSGIALSGGSHVVRLVMDSTGARGFVANLNWFAFR